jgi:hypothetical protein
MVDSIVSCSTILQHFLGTGACSLAHFDASGIPKALGAMVETLKDHAQNHGEHRYNIYIPYGHALWL